MTDVKLSVLQRFLTCYFPLLVESWTTQLTTTDLTAAAEREQPRQLVARADRLVGGFLQNARAACTR
jgi:hypothetical protein